MIVQNLMLKMLLLLEWGPEIPVIKKHVPLFDHCICENGGGILDAIEFPFWNSSLKEALL
jgi:hypothetical protein